MYLLMFVCAIQVGLMQNPLQIALSIVQKHPNCDTKFWRKLFTLKCQSPATIDKTLKMRSSNRKNLGF